jgi:hypothetical protein
MPMGTFLGLGTHSPTHQGALSPPISHHAFWKDSHRTGMRRESR